MKVLDIKTIRTKKELVSLYLSQYSERFVRSCINDIIKMYRPKSTGKEFLLSIQEILSFIELYGLPENYQMSDNLKMELQLRKSKLKI